MDHRIAKDMISSGMIPSGEKKQDDLNKTQYGTAPSPDALSDVYKKMYEHHKKDADGNTIPHEGEEISEAGPLALALGAVKTIAKKKFVKKLAGDVATGAAMSAGSNLMSGGGGGNQNQNKTKNVSSTPPPQTQYASADLFDIVKGQLLDEGYSEKEVNEIMVNLTEEQLEEFLKQLATRAAQHGANIGRKGSPTGFLNQRKNKQAAINVINPKPETRKPFDPKPTPRKPFDAKKPEPKPGDSGFKAKSASDVVTAAAALRKNRMINDMKPKNGEVMQDNADLFDIVKGQLLDEGLSEEEIRDIMLTLTPDEIMEELSDVVKRNDAINKAKAMERAKQNQVPDKVKEASKRQYTAGGPKDTGANKYTTQDKKTIIDYNKNN